MTTDLLIAIATGQGSALIILLLWIRSVIKDRDFYRDRDSQNYTALKIAVEELENRPRPNGPNPGLRMVEGGRP